MLEKKRYTARVANMGSYLLMHLISKEGIKLEPIVCTMLINELGFKRAYDELISATSNASDKWSNKLGINAQKRLMQLKVHKIKKFSIGKQRVVNMRLLPRTIYGIKDRILAQLWHYRAKKEYFQLLSLKSAHIDAIKDELYIEGRRKIAKSKIEKYESAFNDIENIRNIFERRIQELRKLEKWSINNRELKNMAYIYSSYIQRITDYHKQS